MRSTIPLDVVVAMQQKAPAASEKGAKTGVVDLLKARYAEGGMNAIFSFGPPAAPSSFSLCCKAARLWLTRGWLTCRDQGHARAHHARGADDDAHEDRGHAGLRRVRELGRG